MSTSLEDVKEMVIRLHTKMTTESVPEDTNLDNPDDPGTPLLSGMRMTHLKMNTQIKILTHGLANYLGVNLATVLIIAHPHLLH